MGPRGPLITVCALSLCAIPQDSCAHNRAKRQEPDPEPDLESEDYVEDYAGNENNDPPREEPTDNFRDTFTDTQNDIGQHKFSSDTFDGPLSGDKKLEETEEKSEEPKSKKKAKKKHKYLKKTFEFLKRVLDPNKLMENAFITEMLRRFSHNEEPEYMEKESPEEEEEAHTPKPTKKKRGRPKKRDKIPPGITGIIKKGVMTLTQMELDRKKLRRRVRLIKRIARKAKKPLKTAVKIFLSSRNQGMGGYGGGGYGNNNY